MLPFYGDHEEKQAAGFVPAQWVEGGHVGTRHDVLEQPRALRRAVGGPQLCPVDGIVGGEEDSLADGHEPGLHIAEHNGRPRPQEFHQGRF